MQATSPANATGSNGTRTSSATAPPVSRMPAPRSSTSVRVDAREFGERAVRRNVGHARAPGELREAGGRRVQRELGRAAAAAVLPRRLAIIGGGEDAMHGVR